MDIPVGETKVIINYADARDSVEDPDIHGFIVDIDGASVRLLEEENRARADDGIPFQNGDTFTVRPHGHGIVAHNPSSNANTATVTVNSQKFEIGDINR